MVDAGDSASGRDETRNIEHFIYTYVLLLIYENCKWSLRKESSGKGINIRRTMCLSEVTMRESHGVLLSIRGELPLAVSLGTK